MNANRRLARSYRRLARAHLWLLTPLFLVNAGFNAAIAFDQPVRWALVALSLAAAAFFILTSRANRTVARSYENAADEQDKADNETAALRADGAGRITVREAVTAAEALGREVQLEQIRGTSRDRALVYGLAAVLAHDRDQQETR